MAFRTVEISNPAEIHVKNGQLQITNENGIVNIPIEDVSHIFCMGPDIRISTLAMSKLAINKVVMTTLDEKYLPTAMVIPYEGNSRQSQLMHSQISCGEYEKRMMWKQIVYKKISNQSRVLSILGLEGVEKVMEYALELSDENADYNEALAAKHYFSLFHPGLNRRVDEPIDVDIVVHKNIGSNIILIKQERYELAHVLHNACIMEGHKMSILSAIDIMVESLRRCYLEKHSSLLCLPTVIPEENMELVNE